MGIRALLCMHYSGKVDEDEKAIVRNPREPANANVRRGSETKHQRLVNNRKPTINNNDFNHNGIPALRLSIIDDLGIKSG